MDKKKLAINMAASIISFLVSFAISFLLTPFIIENMGSEAYGFFTLGNQFISYATIVTAALNSMASRFVTICIHKNDIEKRNQYFSSVVISNAILSAVLAVPATLIVVWLDHIIVISQGIEMDVKILWALIFINFLLSIITNAYSIATFAANKLYLNSIRSIESSLLRVFLLLFLFSLFQPSLYFLGVASVLCTLYTVVFNVYYTRKLYPDLRCKRRYFSLGRVVELVSSGIWNSFTQLANVLNNGLDLWIANLLISATAMGTLSASKTIPIYFAQIISVFGATFQPELAKNYAQEDKEALLKNIRFARGIMTIIAVIPVAILAVNGDVFYRLWLPSQDASQLQLLTFASMFIYIFVGSLTTVSDVVLLVNKQKYVAITFFLAGILNVIVVFFSLKYIGENHVTWGGMDTETIKLLVVVGVSGIIAIVRNLCFTPIYAAHCLKEKWYVFYPMLIKGVVCFVLTALIAFVVRNTFYIGSWFTFLVSSAIIAIFGALISTLILFNRQEIRKLLKKITRH